MDTVASPISIPAILLASETAVLIDLEANSMLVIAPLFRPFDLAIIGVLVLAAVTSIGGGTIRDLLIGATPVFWIKDSHYLLTIALTGIVGMGVARVQHRWPWYVLPLLDAVGLALFVVIGAQKALSYGTSGVIAVIMGCITGVAGGVVRDILAREIPMVLRKEVYVTACLLSGSIYVVLLEFGMGHVASMFAIGISRARISRTTQPATPVIQPISTAITPEVP
jgi:uncharacterized membrane protein YeiH